MSDIKTAAHRHSERRQVRLTPQVGGTPILAPELPMEVGQQQVAEAPQVQVLPLRPRWTSPSA
jgi:hypothetical protein